MKLRLASALAVCGFTAGYLARQYTRQQDWVTAEELGGSGNGQSVSCKGQPDVGSNRANWKLAVLYIGPETKKYHIGFSDGTPHTQTYRRGRVSGGVIGMLVGPNDVQFWVRHKDFFPDVVLIEVTDQNSPRWPGLRRY